MQLSEFRDLLANDGFAATFQTMGQYRTELLRSFDGLRAQADARPVAWRVTGHWKDGAQANPFFYTDEALADMHAEHLASAVIAPLYTHPEASAPGLSEDAWLALAERHIKADWNSEQPDGYLNAVKALAQDAMSLTRASAATVAEPSTCKRCDGVGTFLGNADGYDDETCDTCGGTGKQKAKPIDKAFKVITWSSATDREFATHDEALAYIRSNAPNDWHIETMQAAQQQAEPQTFVQKWTAAIKSLPMGEQQAEPHPSQTHPTFQTVSLPNGPGTPSAQTFDRRIACKPGRPEWKSCEQQGEPGADERAMPEPAVYFGQPLFTAQQMREFAAQSGQRAAVAEGWQLVPEEPTPEMIAAFKRAFDQGSIWTGRVTHAYKAALSAAPTQQQEGGEN